MRVRCQIVDAWEDGDMTKVSRETSTSALYEVSACGAVRHWSDAELTELRAILRCGLFEACRRHVYYATFHGCRVEIVRERCADGSRMTFRIHLSGRLETALVLRVSVVLEAVPALRPDIAHLREPEWHSGILSGENQSLCPTGSTSSGGRAAGVTLAESARWVHVTHQPRSKEHPNRPHLLKAGGPQPGDSSASQYPSRGVQSPVRDRSPQLPCERRS